MWNLNNVVPDAGFKGELIPQGTVARAILTLKPGGSGPGGWFKDSAAGNMMLECEYTITEGPFALRKVWDRMVVAGSEKATEISLKRVRALCDSGFMLDPDDTSDAARARRANFGPEQLNGLEVCIKIGIEPARDQYEARNKILAIITRNEKAFLKPGQTQQGGAPTASSAVWQAPTAQQAAPPQQASAPPQQPPAGGGSAFGWGQ